MGDSLGFGILMAKLPSKQMKASYDIIVPLNRPDFIEKTVQDSGGLFYIKKVTS